MQTENKLNARHGYLVEPISHQVEAMEDLSPHVRYEKRMKRKNQIVRAAILGIVMCILFAIVKYFIGISAHSLAIKSDAVSSLTESYSSIVAVIGILLAHKKPSKRFPNGFGRIEFITVIIGGIFVIVAGWHFLESSLRRIQSPEIATVTEAQIIIIVVTIIGKLYLYFVDKRVGKDYSSAGLITASRNALLSCFSSGLVILSAVFAHYFGVDIDGWVGLIISVLMIVTGIIGVRNGMRPLLGMPVSSETADMVSAILLKQEPIVGVYDLRLTNNGAGIIRGTVNAEVPYNIDAEEIYDAFRSAESEVYRKLGIILTIGLLTVNYCDDNIYPIFDEISRRVLALDGVENLHGFKYNQDTGEVDLHVIIDFDHLNDEELEKEIETIVNDVIPDADALLDFNVNYLDHIPEKKVLACSLDLDS